ncbi:hypothetical protein [Micromonospora chalcea]|uniref:hypothetical protein n=1 Tax=Micromonospora chalcea TaxID=1874 RepID=UPI00378F423B
MRARVIPAALVTAALLAGCGAEAPVAPATRSPSPSPSATPGPEHEGPAVLASVRRAVGRLGPVERAESTENASVLLGLCDKPIPMVGGYGNPVTVGSFFTVRAETRPVAYRAGGQRGEAIAKVRVVAAREPDATPPLVEQAFEAVRGTKCTGGATHVLGEPHLVVVGYQGASAPVRVAGTTGVLATLTAESDRLQSGGWYPLMGHARVIVRHRGYLVEASVLCARPARPGDRKAVAAEARTRAVALAERIVRELGALPAAPTPGA